MVVPLSQLNAGEQAQVVWIASEPDTARRLTDLGFAPQEPVTCVIKGPDRCMSAYQIRDSVIALRAANAAEILVKLSSAGHLETDRCKHSPFYPQRACRKICPAGSFC